MACAPENKFIIELANYILTRNPMLFQMTDLVLNPKEVKQIHTFFIWSLACLIFHLDSTVTTMVFPDQHCLCSEV